MECADACRNFATTGAPTQCPAGQQPIQCINKADSRPSYTCGKGERTQFCHGTTKSTGRATNQKR